MPNVLFFVLMSSDQALPDEIQLTKKVVLESVKPS